MRLIERSGSAVTDVYNLLGLREFDQIGALLRKEADTFKVAQNALGLSPALGRLRVAENFPRYDTEQWRIACGLIPYDLMERTRGVANFSSVLEDLHIKQTFLPENIIGLRDAAAGSFAAIYGLKGLARIDFDHALKTAQIAGSIALPGVLEAYRTATDQLASKLALAQLHPSWDEQRHLGVFGQFSAYSDLLSASLLVGNELRRASAAITALEIPKFGSLADCRWFLDSAGLTLPRWPRIRRLSAAEKRQKFKSKLKEHSEPRPAREAKSMIHRYENVLREFIDDAMASEFGDDWAEQRLPLCNCRDLVGKWKNRGGHILSHADFAHYIRIMSHPEHFEAVFAAGFDDPNELVKVLEEARRLRAASHHGRAFTAEDLRDLRIAWRTIETGLISLMPGHSFDFD
jgi:hypothetical protein